MVHHDDRANVIDTAAARSRAAWPGVELSAADFRAHVSPRLDEHADLGQIHWEDLYLACACTRGDGAAIALFDARVLADVPRYVRHVDGSSAFADEVRQRLRERLLVGPAPKIADYAGRGPLGGWIRVAAVRLALNLRRERGRGKRREDDLEAEDILPPVRDPELEILRARYAADVRAAFASTLGALGADERNVLRMHYLDGLSLEAVANAYGIHRATVARWIQGARERIITETRQRLAARVGASTSEVDSLIGLVRSQLEVSFHRLLGAVPDE